MTQIVRCKVENILGAKDVEFAPNGNGVTIGGANGQGKSSAIWALVMALGGKGQIPQEPVHKGEEKGSVTIELDKFTVTMEVKANRSSTLTVQSSDGAQYRSPQTMLNALFGGLSFDPGEFMKLDQAKRFKTLIELLKIDPSELEEKERTLREQRRDVGRDVKILEGKISGRSFHKDAPEEELSVSALVQELEEAQAHNRKRFAQEQEVSAQKQEIRNIAEENTRFSQQIAELQQSIKDNEKRREELELESHKLFDSLQPEIDCDPLHAKIAGAEETNQKVRENAETERIKSELDAKRKEYEGFTSQIEGLEKEKQQLLSGAELPIEGLSLASGAILYNGVPLEQASESEQWEVSTAMGFALNPSGIVFMRNCGGLDRRSRDRVRERAAALGVQLFLEVVDDASDVQLLIEEGHVKENRLTGEVRA